jgi:hypothetical protein
MLNVISIYAKTVFQMTCLHPSDQDYPVDQPRLSTKHHGDENYLHPWQQKTAVLILEERLNYLRVPPDRSGARHCCHGVHPATFSYT